MLAVNQLAINLYVKNAAPAFDQLNLHVVLTFDGGRQTGGFGRVISLYAVFDADFHLENLRIS